MTKSFNAKVLSSSFQTKQPFTYLLYKLRKNTNQDVNLSEQQTANPKQLLAAEFETGHSFKLYISYIASLNENSILKIPGVISHFI